MQIVSPFQAFQHVAVNVGYHGVGVHDTVMDVGNHGVGVYNTVVDIGNNHMCGYCKLSLQADGEKQSIYG